MHIDSVKGLLRAALGIMKELDKNLCANIAVIKTRAKPIKKTDAPLAEQVNELLDDPETQRLVDEKYAAIFAQIEKSIEDRELLEILSSWKPDGKIQ
jgi:hypothetical protein